MILRFDKKTDLNNRFVKELFFAQKKNEFSAENWQEEILASVLEAQFIARQDSYKREYPNSHEYVVFQQDVPVGWLLLDKSETIHIVHLMIDERYRGNGIGTEIVQRIITMATLEKKQVTLFLDKKSRVQNLYSKLGFRVQTSSEMFVVMST